MANYQVENLGENHMNLSITLDAAEYGAKWKKEISKIQHNAQIKGFRKGKTPMTTVQKMYGPGALADIVNEMVNTQLDEYIKTNSIKYLGQPMLLEDSAPNLDMNKMEDLVFTFEIGIQPEIQTPDYSKFVFDYDKVVVPQATVDQEVDDLVKRFGNQEPVDSLIEDNDMVKISATELEFGVPKANGWQVPISFLVNMMPNEDLKKDMLKKKKGDTFQFTLADIEKSDDDKFLRKQILRLEEDDTRIVGDSFQGVIEEVTRVVPRTPDADFFKELFRTEEELTLEQGKEKISEIMASQYDGMADGLLFIKIKDELVNSTPMTLPSAFLKKWLETKENDNNLLNDESFAAFEKDIKWSLISERIQDDLNVEVTEDEVVYAFRVKYARMLNIDPGNDMLTQFIPRFMSNQEEVNKMATDIRVDKMFGRIKDQVQLKNIPIDPKSLQDKIEAFNQALKKNKEIPEAEVVED